MSVSSPAYSLRASKDAELPANVVGCIGVVDYFTPSGRYSGRLRSESVESMGPKHYPFDPPAGSTLYNGPTKKDRSRM